MFKNWFKPKWRHSNAEIRIKALDELKLKKEKNQAIFIDVMLHELNEEVRSCAASGLESASEIISFLEKETSFLVKSILIHQVSLLIVEPNGSLNEKEKIDLIAKVDDEKELEFILNHSPLQSIQLQAIEKKISVDLLEYFAVHGKFASVRKLAAEKINDINILKRIKEKTKRFDKVVFKLIKEKIDKDQEEGKLEKEKNIQSEILCQQLEKLSRVPDSLFFLGQYQVICKRWETFPIQDKKNLESRFLSAKLICEQIIEKIRVDELLSEKEKNLILSEKENMALVCSEIEGLHSCIFSIDTAKDFDCTSFLSALDIASVKLKGLNKSVLDMSHKYESDKLIKACYEQVKIIESLKTLCQEGAYCKNLKLKIEKKKDLDFFNKKNALFKKRFLELKWPITIKKIKELTLLQDLSSEFDTYLNQMTQKEKEYENEVRKYLEHAFVEMKEGHFSSVGIQAKKIKEILEWLPPEKYKELHHQFLLLIKQLDEMKDWAGFATLPKREALCQEMRLLIEAEIPKEDKWNLLQKLQDDWKKLGQPHANDDRALALSFRDLGQKVFLKIEDHLAEKKSVREANLSRKEQICTELKNYIEHMNWEQADWYKVIETVNLSKKEWSLLFETDLIKGKKLKQEFDSLIKELERKINNERSQNLLKKEKLVDDSFKLKDMENIEDAIILMQKIKKDWREIGFSYKKETDKLWQDLEKISSVLQERKNENSKEFQKKLEENKKKYENIIFYLKNIDLEDFKIILAKKEEIEKIKIDIENISPLPRKEAYELKRSFSKQIHLLDKALKDAKKNEIKMMYKNLIQKSILCEELEKSSAHKIYDQDLIKEVKLAWHEVGEVPDAYEAALNARFDYALDALKTMTYTVSDELIKQNQEKLQNIAVYFEILAGIQPPKVYEKLKASLQVIRLSESINAKKKDFQTEVYELISQRVNIQPFHETYTPYFERCKIALEQLNF